MIDRMNLIALLKQGWKPLLATARIHLNYVLTCAQLSMAQGTHYRVVNREERRGLSDVVSEFV